MSKKSLFCVYIAAKVTTVIYWLGGLYDLFTSMGDSEEINISSVINVKFSFLTYNCGSVHKHSQDHMLHL